MSIARPCGVFNKTYAQELIIVRTRTQWAFLVLGLVFLFTLPLYSNSYILNVANLMGITLLAVLGLHILMGLCGQISIGQSAFMCVGAYVTAALVNSAHLSFWLALPIAIIASGLVGILVGLPSLRVKGFYLAMATLAAQVLIPWIVGRAWTDVTGGTQGLQVKPIDIFGIPLLEQTGMFFVIWPMALLGLYFAINIARGRVGRAFVAIRDNDLAAEVMGISLFRYKLIAFAISALYAGAAGAFWAEWIRFINPDQFTLHGSILYLGMLIVGGVGSSAGAVMGVIFMTIIEEIAKTIAPQIGVWLGMPPGTTASALAPGAFGLVILLFLIFEPRGLAHRWEVFKSSYRLNPFSY